jgi:hypothetical protein
MPKPAAVAAELLNLVRLYVHGPIDESCPHCVFGLLASSSCCELGLPWPGWWLLLLLLAAAFDIPIGGAAAAAIFAMVTA